MDHPKTTTRLYMGQGCIYKVKSKPNFGQKYM